MEKEKSQLLEAIEKLLSFDGNATEINPDYLAYFSLEELQRIFEELQKRQEKMIEDNRNWIYRFAHTVECPKKGS